MPCPGQSQAPGCGLATGSVRPLAFTPSNRTASSQDRVTSHVIPLSKSVQVDAQRISEDAGCRPISGRQECWNSRELCETCEFVKEVQSPISTARRSKPKAHPMIHDYGFPTDELVTKQ